MPSLKLDLSVKDDRLEKNVLGRPIDIDLDGSPDVTIAAGRYHSSGMKLDSDGYSYRFTGKYANSSRSMWDAVIANRTTAAKELDEIDEAISKRQKAVLSHDNSLTQSDCRTITLIGIPRGRTSCCT